MRTYPTSAGALAGIAAAGVLTSALVAQSAAEAAPREEIYVSDYYADAIDVFPRLASGDVKPTRRIRGGLDQPHTISVDLLHREMFVANNLYWFELPAVNVYDMDPGLPGSDVPKRTIAGSLTGLNRPAGVLVDAIHQELYVANDVDYGSSITVYPLDASGDVAPVRTLRGSATGIQGPIGLALDPVHDELIVACYKVAEGGSISFFPRTASENTAPLRVIHGPHTGLNLPQGIGLDLAHDEIVVANSAFESAEAGNVLVFARTDYGDASPVRQIGGPTTALCNPVGIALDLVNDEIVVANSRFGSGPCAQSVATYGRAASGDTAPVRRIGPGPSSAFQHPTGIVVATRVDCADPSVAPGTPCDDGSACTTGDSCAGGLCVGAAPLACDDSNPCTLDACDPAAGCTHAVQEGDADADGVCDAGDCAPGDAGAFAVPAELTDLRVADGTSTLTWSSGAPGAGAGTVSDLLRGSLAELPVGFGPTELCLGSGLAGTTATDAEVPPSSAGWWYLVRGRNVCGAGPYGFASGGTESVSSACP